MLDAIRRDLSHAIRSLRRTPAFTTTVILILGLGIGMASAMFTVFQSILLKRLPVQDQDRVVELPAVGKGVAAKQFPLTFAQYHRVLAQARTLQSIAGFEYTRTLEFTLRDRDRAYRLQEAAVTGNFFQVLGAAPAVGRLFQPEDEREWRMTNSTLSIVISYGTWRHAFGGDSSIIGRHVQEPTGHQDMIVLGVAPPGLDYPRGVDFWVAGRGYGIWSRASPPAQRPRPHGPTFWRSSITTRISSGSSGSIPSVPNCIRWNRWWSATCGRPFWLSRPPLPCCSCWHA